MTTQSSFFVSMARGVVLAMALAAASAQAAGAPGAEWRGYANDLASQRYSPLIAINAGNAARLRSICRIALGDPGSLESGILMLNSTLYLTTVHTTVALDARTCALRWRTVDTIGGPEAGHANRGLAYLDGRLFRGTQDGRLEALDAKTGAVLWSVQAGDTVIGESMAAAPIAWNGLVYMGPAGSDVGIRGRVSAFDAATGKEVWRFNTIPQGDDFGAETWQIPESAKRGGGATWTSYTLDPATGEVFVPVANPGPDFDISVRPGANLFTNSVVVLDARTGKLKWYYQVRPNDGFDWDLGAAPMLYRTPSGAQRVALGSKDGFVYLLDRATHRLVARTAVTTSVNADKAPTPQGTYACPGPLGGVEWNGPGYNPKTGAVYVGAVDWCNTFVSGAQAFTPGQLYLGTSIDLKGDNPRSGWVSALDGVTGKLKWRFHTPAPVVAGVTSTASGLVMTGDLAGNFYVFDAVTGRVLQRRNLGGALAGGVITYAVGQRQYVAATVGNISRSSFGDGGPPQLVILSADGPSGGPPRVLAVSDTDTPTRSGHDLYGSLCAACHGANGEGGAGGASLVGISGRRSHDQVVAWIKAPKPPMPKLFPGALSASDVEAVARYVESFSKRP